VERSYPVVFLAVFALVTVGAVVVAGSVSGAAFSTYNPAWDGTAEMRSLAQETGVRTDIVRDTEYYQTTDPEGTVVVVLSPDTAYTADEATAIREFVDRGGTVVVAGDFGDPTTQLLEDLDVAARLDGTSVRDERHYERSPALPRATNVTTHPYTTAVDQLTLNHATVVRFGDSNTNATRLVNTSSFAYLDTNGNGELDDAETLRTYTVAAVERVNGGSVVTVSDPSLFINAMLDREDNRQFARNVLGAHDRLGVDLSHAGGLPPVAWVVVTARNSAVVQLVGGAALVLGLARWRRIADAGQALLSRLTGPEPEPPTVSRDALLASLQQRHPEWDDHRLRRVVQTLIHREENSETDE